MRCKRMMLAGSDIPTITLAAEGGGTYSVVVFGQVEGWTDLFMTLKLLAAVTECSATTQSDESGICVVVPLKKSESFHSLLHRLVGKVAGVAEGHVRFHTVTVLRTFAAKPGA
ncbi:hypothetical protein K2Q16_03890 [Patescibacteria group bacterium]|nr:hypothetical protein [Patescibacteria group bacterium]